MNQDTRTSKTRSQPPHALRIGIVQGGHIVEERLLGDAAAVTIGQSPRNVFTLCAAGLPRTYRLFRRDKDRHVLRFAPGMEGRVTVGGRPWTLTQACEAGLARRAGDWLELPLEPGARGKLRLGEVTVLFQHLRQAPARPLPRLPASLQGGVASRVDPGFAKVLSGAMAVAAMFLVAVQLVPKPTGNVRTTRMKALMDSRTRLQRPAPQPRRLAAAAHTRSKDAPGDNPSAVATSADAARRARIDAARRADPGAEAIRVKKGTPEYHALLKDLTNIQVDRNQMSAIALSGKCRGQQKCDRAETGPDVLRNGGSFGDLAQAAERSAGIGAHRPGGPSTHARRPGLAHNGGRPVVTSTRTGPSATPATKPRRDIQHIKKPRSTHTFQQPMTPPRGGASISAKVRPRVYRLRYCYNQLLPSQPTLSGSVKISFVVQPNGRVQGVSVSTGMGRAMKSCVQSRVARWHLGKLKLANAVHYGPFYVRFHPKH